MLSQKNFKIGNNIEETIYEYDENNVEHRKTIIGKIFQTTKYFAVIDNGKYKECFRYSQFSPCYNITGRTVDKELEEYQDDIVEDCIENFNEMGKGFVFNLEQLEKVINSNKLKGEYGITEEDKIIYISKK